MSTNAILPLRTGAASFTRVLGSKLKNSGPVNDIAL